MNCVSHAEKRIGSRLQNVKKENKLGGRRRLTDTLIKKLTKYYQLAIRSNIESADEMEKAIMATYFHLCSTDENPSHENCPVGTNSCCGYRAAQASGINFNHPPPLHPDVEENIFPIYESLSNSDLLERCLSGHTQNGSESINATVWRLILAAGIYNEGYVVALNIMQTLEITIGPQSKLYADNYKAEPCMARSQLQIEHNELFEEAEGLLYGPGIANYQKKAVSIQKSLSFLYFSLPKTLNVFFLKPLSYNWRDK